MSLLRPVAPGLRAAGPVVAIARALLLLAALLAALPSTAPGARAQAGAPTEPAGAPPAPAPVERPWDVIVAGSEPEGIAAAVAAAEAGARTLLVTRDARVGGLFVLGQMNVLDLRTTPTLYHRGLFERWWERVGYGTAFDVVRAERAFEAMLAEAGVQVVRGVAGLEPWIPVPAAPGGAPAVRGVVAGGVVHPARQVIDATGDADLAAAAGAPWTLGFASLGYPRRMADTLVFRMAGVDWEALRAAARERGRSWAVVDARTAYGHFGGVPAAYRAVEEGVRLRGLNLGRQDDGTVLVNALLIHGIDPFDPASRAAGRERAAREAARIVAYLAERLPGLEGAVLAGTAPELYVRETRHVSTRCTLTVDDVLDNRESPLDVAVGGYPLDVQALTPQDTGFVFGTPVRYGARLCMTVPRGVEGLWVVGRAAGWDPIAASSARVVPFGMTVAEAVGVAAAWAADDDALPAAFAADDAAQRQLRDALRSRGAYLPAPAGLAPVGPFDHPHHDAYRTMLGRGLALGGYGNDPALDSVPPAMAFVYLLANVAQRFFGDEQAARALVDRWSGLDRDEPLGPVRAREIAARFACEVAGACTGPDWAAMAAAGVVPAGFAPTGELTRGEQYEIAAGIARMAPGAGDE